MGEGWDGGDDPPHLNPLPPGERKLCIETQLTRPLQEILEDGGLISHGQREFKKAKCCLARPSPVAPVSQTSLLPQSTTLK